MTLLSRGITSSQQGLSYLDRAIAKAEADDQEFKSNVNLYNDTLEGFKSSSTYLGNRSRNILNEYSKAFEGAIDMYAADPSEENQQRIDNIKLQTLDFYNRAVAARQNSLTQLNSFRANPANYNISLEEALQQFSDAEDANVFARFDMNSMEMLVGEGESQQTIGNVGYYNGVDPMFFEKAPSIGTIEAEGTYAANNLDRYYSLIGTDEGKEKIIEGFMETARPSTSTYQETAIYNYIQDVKGVDLSKIKSEVELRDRILEVRNDPAELSAALRHMGELEYDWMLGAKNAKQLQASQDKFNALFRGDFETRTDAKRAEVTMTPQDGELGDYVDNLYGVERVRRLKNARGTGTAAGDIAGLSEYGDNLLGYEVDAIGNIIVLVDKTIPDPEDEEKTKKELHTYVLTGDNPDERMNDLYDNLYRELKADGIFDMLKNQSYQRQLQIERNAKIAREKAAWANTPEHTAPDEFITTTVEDVRLATGPSLDKRREQTKEQQIEDIQSQFNFTGNNAILVSPRRGRRGMDVAALNRSFVDRLVEEGYNPQEIKQGIEYMQKEGITVGVSPLRNFLQTLGLPTRYGRADLGIGGDDMSKAVSAFQDALVELNPEKYLTGPKPLTEADAYKLKSKGLFGIDFTATDSDVIDNIFQEEGYSADGVLVNVPPTENSGVTIGGLDLGKSAGNIQEKLDILSKYIPEDQMEALKSLQGLVGQEAEKALSDSLSSKELDPSTWGMTDDTLRQIQSDFISINTIPSIAKKMGVSEKDLEELPEQVLTAVTSMEFMTPGTNAIKAVAKAMKSGSKEDWLAAADMYENYYGSKDQVEEKLKDGRILQGNVDRAKRAAELIRSVYS